MDVIEHWSDETLQDGINECAKDLEKASMEEPNSEWHQACFAAWFVMTEEMATRKLRANGIH